MKMQTMMVRILMLAVGVMLTQCAFTQEHRAVNLSDAKGLPFSNGIVVGNTLYIAGHEGEDASGKLVPGGITPETKAALENIEKVVKAAGFELKDIVSVTVYLANINDFPEMNTVYKNFMPDPKPARATIQAAALVGNARIEISAIAIKSRRNVAIRKK